MVCMLKKRFSVFHTVSASYIVNTLAGSLVCSPALSYSHMEGRVWEQETR